MGESVLSFSCCPVPGFSLWLRPVLVPQVGSWGETQASCHEVQVHQNKGGKVCRGQSPPNWYDVCHQSDVDFYAQADVEASR